MSHHDDDHDVPENYEGRNTWTAILVGLVLAGVFWLAVLLLILL